MILKALRSLPLEYNHLGDSFMKLEKNYLNYFYLKKISNSILQKLKANNIKHTLTQSEIDLFKLHNDTNTSKNRQAKEIMLMLI